jgi:hypothetical protein
LLCGCFEPGIQQGWIYAKHYYPAWTSYSSGYSTTSCSGSGKSRRCTSTYHAGHLIYHAASYSLDISSCRNVNSSECKRNTLYVNESEYNRYSVGSYYGEEQ